MITSTSKRCKKCGKVKALRAYYRRGDSKDRRQSYCKGCSKRGVRTWKSDNGERISTLRKKHFQTYAANNATKIRAREKTRAALKRGEIKLGRVCAWPGCCRTDVQAHHNDLTYRNWRDITPACPLHHPEMDRRRALGLAAVPRHKDVRVGEVRVAI